MGPGVDPLVGYSHPFCAAPQVDIGQRSACATLRNPRCLEKALISHTRLPACTLEMSSTNVSVKMEGVVQGTSPQVASVSCTLQLLLMQVQVVLGKESSTIQPNDVNSILAPWKGCCLAKRTKYQAKIRGLRAASYVKGGGGKIGSGERAFSSVFTFSPYALISNNETSYRRLLDK